MRPPEQPDERIDRIIREAGWPLPRGGVWVNGIELTEDVYWLDISSLELPGFESGTLEIELDDYEPLFSGEVSTEAISGAEAARILDEIDSLPEVGS